MIHHAKKNQPGISIHALLAESDCLPGFWRITAEISIHALLAESALAPQPPQSESSIFLSTLSLRRATIRKRQVIPVIENFYPRSPCGERLDKRCQFNGDNGNFYPRSPCGERPRETTSIKPIFRDFYPRSPCGERPNTREHLKVIKIFLSTLSLRRATAKVHKTVGHFCAYETNFMGIASSC